MKHHRGHEHHSMHHSKGHHGHKAMHEGYHSEGMGSDGHGMYRNEVEKPHQNMQGKPEHGHGLDGFYDQAMDIAYGQSGKVGMEMDDKRLRSQYKNYHWADSPAVEMPGSF